jgi:hypothetical protein
MNAAAVFVLVSLAVLVLVLAVVPPSSQVSRVSR